MIYNYICEDCGEVFEEYHQYCPACVGYGVEKAELCTTEKCHEYMVEGDYCCRDCKEEAVKVLSDALVSLSIGQIKYLNSLLEDEPLIKFWRDN